MKQQDQQQPPPPPPFRKVQLVDLQANYRSIKAEVDEAIHRVLDSAYYVGGPDVAAFEAEFAAFVGSKHCVGLSNGTDSLVLSLRALGVGVGDEVIVQANTFVASVLAVSAVGATPVLVDATPDTIMMDVARVEALINERTKVLMPVHLYGMAVDMDAIMALATKHKLLVVEDAAQAHGAKYNGKAVGTIGNVGSFSFYPGKNLGAYGDGGCIVTDNAQLAHDVRMLRNYGMVKKYHHEVKGMNHRLDSLQAAVLRVRLRHLAEWNQRRCDVARVFSARLAGVGDLTLPIVPPRVDPVWHLYVIRTARRDQLLAYLNKCGIGAGIHYPIPVHELVAYPELLPQGDRLPVASTDARRMLSLPIHPDLVDDDLDHIIACVMAFFDDK